MGKKPQDSKQQNKLPSKQKTISALKIVLSNITMEKILSNSVIIHNSERSYSVTKLKIPFWNVLE